MENAENTNEQPDLVSSLTEEQRQQMTPVLERIYEMELGVRCGVITIAAHPLHGETFRVEIDGGIVSVLDRFGDSLARFHRLYEPQAPLPRRLDARWELYRTTDPEGLNLAVEIIRSLELRA